MNFNSQICTSREQSKRLLALGLKKETADMVIFRRSKNADWEISPYSYNEWQTEIMFSTFYDKGDIIPAWSLHRLIEMMPKSIYHKSLACFLFIDQSVYVEYRHSLYGASQTIMEQFMKSNLWENLIDCIKWLIKEGYFNKNFLEEKK